MPTYAYTAIEHGGKQVTGSLTAENAQVAAHMLEDQSLFPLAVDESSGKSAITGRGKRIKLRYLTTFYQQMADLLRSGVPMLRSLEVLSDQEGSPAVLRRVLREAREDVAGGSTFADALEKNSTIFAPLQCSMIRAGESGGFLEDVLARLSIFADKQDDLRNKLIGAMIYPALLMCAGTAVVIFIMTFVVPKLEGHMREDNYNWMTHVVFGTCHLITGYYPHLIVAVVAIVMGFSAFKRTEYGRRSLAMAQLRAPIIGKLYTMVSVSRFCRILGTLLQNGVSILQALKISKDSAGNEILSEQIEAAAESVRRGETLSEPLGRSGLFPGDILSMIAVAEESNNLENVLVQIAETNETRTARAIDTSVRLVEPLLLFFMALVVGGIAFALLLPILKMGATGAR